MGKQSRDNTGAGLENGALQMCPDRPSCVSSVDKRERHAIAAFELKGSAAESLDKLESIIKGMKKTAIIEKTEVYLHATFTSGLFKFIDDVEFLVKDDEIQVRSVSRVGYSDLGVNRKRVEAIRAEY